MENEKIVATLELSDKCALVFSLRVFKGRKYAAITKFLGHNSDNPKPIGGLILNVDKFKEMFVAMDGHTEELLDPVEKEIAVVQIKDGEILRVGVSVYNGKPGIDLRKYIIQDGNNLPTRKGVRIPIEEVDSLEDCLQKLFELL
jgi:hypothetical protein